MAEASTSSPPRRKVLIYVTPTGQCPITRELSERRARNRQEQRWVAAVTAELYDLAHFRLAHDRPYDSTCRYPIYFKCDERFRYMIFYAVSARYIGVLEVADWRSRLRPECQHEAEIIARKRAAEWFDATYDDVAGS